MVRIPHQVFGSFDRRLPDEQVAGEWPDARDALEAARKYLTKRSGDMKSSISISKTKRGTSIRAKGSAANALFNAMTKPILEEQMAKWNQSVKVGDKVEYREIPEAEPQIFTTRTEAEILSGHTVVVWLNGKSGCVCVSHCKLVTE